MADAPAEVGADPQRTALLLRVLAGDAGAAHLWFSPRLLDHYRAQPGFRVIRTNSVGRVRAPAGWSVDFGIVEPGATAPDGLIHVPAGDLAQRLPEAERRRWAEHAVGPPLSRAFVTMRLSPGACIDDGDTRDW